MSTFTSLPATSLPTQFQLTAKLRQGYEGLVYGPFLPDEPSSQMRLALFSDPSISVDISVDTLTIIQNIDNNPQATDIIIRNATSLIVQPRFSEDMRHILTYFINRQTRESQPGILTRNTYWREIMLCAVIVGRAFVALCEPMAALRRQDMGRTLLKLPNEVEYMVLEAYSSQRRARLTGLASMIENIISPVAASSLPIETSTSQYKTDVPYAFCVLVLFLTSFDAIRTMEMSFEGLNRPALTAFYAYLETYFQIWTDLPDFFKRIFKTKEIPFLSQYHQDFSLLDLIMLCRETDWYSQRSNTLRTRFRHFTLISRPFSPETSSIFIDKQRKRCYLCRRKFDSLEILLEHQRRSNLHLANLQNGAMRAAAIARHS